LNQQLLQFSYLQVLDFLTTIAFLLHGVQEANPLVRLAIYTAPNPIGALVSVKLLAIGLGLFCWKRGRDRLLMKMNVMFAVLVAWNLVALIAASIPHAA